MIRERRSFRAALISVVLAIATLLLLTCTALAQVGADARPKLTPKPSVPKTQPKRTITGTTTNSTPRPKPQPAKPKQTVPPIEMVSIPAGTFLMGSLSGQGDDDEHPQHQVSVAAFYMGKYEVTQAQWTAVMSNNPSYYKGCDQCPVEQVSWDETQEFIRLLNGMQSQYSYSLPTEAEWEYAARAGTTGDYAGDLDSMAWYHKNSGNKTHPVGQKQPNAWNLYDMHGNVWEWVQDWLGAYPNGEVTDPQGPGLGSYRGLRGGGWLYNAARCRSASRGGNSPGSRGPYLGFRLVRTLR